MLNPYIAGAPVTEASMFFGRQDVFDWIERSLAGKYVDHILVIHGQRRVGKTSVLKQIPNFLPDRYIQVYFDLQGRTQTTLDRFLWWLGREIARTLRAQLGLDIPRPDQEAFTQDSEYFHTQFLSGLKPLLDDRVLLLTFDEFDTLSQVDITDGMGRALTDYLSRLFDMEGLNFIFSIGSSGKKLENMQAAYTEFFKAALYKKISFLSEGDSHQLITRPVEGVLTYDPSAVERIFEITSGHPYYTQLTCHELFSNCQKLDKKHITQVDVDEVLPDVVERGTVNLKFVWDEAYDLEKWALASLAQGDRIVDFKDLADELRHQKVRFSDPDLNSALLHLREKDVLTKDNRFIVDLMRLWLRMNRPLDRVREELVEVNPIANRFIEIGDEYREQGASQEAIQSYAAALSADPDNLKAQVSIAKIHLAEKDYQQAAEAFEKALHIDPEDILSRSSFCEAVAALGSEALSKGDSQVALQNYRRVVAVDPEHSEARLRLSAILCKQAEEDLDQGRDEEALKTFNAALEYTPDDEALQARYDEVCEQVKDKVLADLLKKAEAEQKRKNWEKAINHLEDYLRFEHGDAEVVARLAEARLQQHLSQLATLKAKAEEMAKAERWKQAVEAWQAYLELDPEERKEAQAALHAAQRYQQLDESYRKAQEALRAKDYPQAIQLFQGIIAREPAYKDTARLLAEAIIADRRRKPAWLRPWVWVVVIIVIITAAAGVFGRDALAYLSIWNESPAPTAAAGLVATQATNTPVISNTPTRAATLTATPPPATPTPPPTATAIPAWIVDFGQPVLDYITSNKPDFEDDFSEVRPEWRLNGWSEEGGTLTLPYADYVTDGALTLEIEPNTALVLMANHLDNPDFALQYDLIQDLGSPAVYGTNFRESDAGAYGLRTYGSSGTSWNWEFYKQIQETGERLARGSSEVIGYRKLFQVLLIVKGDQFAVFFNDQPAGIVQDSTFTNGNVSLDFFGGSGPGRIKLDNLKYWELKDGFAPGWVAEFAQPILDEIEGKEPDIVEDFSDPSEGWVLSKRIGEGTASGVHLADYIQDGALNLALEKNIVYALRGDFVNGFDETSDFALQYDFTADAGVGLRNMQFSFKRNEFFDFWLLPGTRTWWIKNEVNSSNDTYGEYLKDPSYQVLILASGDQMAVFMNGRPLGYAKAPNYQDPDLINLFTFTSLNNPSRATLDNIQFWKLKAP